jgi:hypothetical protein
LHLPKIRHCRRAGSWGCSDQERASWDRAGSPAFDNAMTNSDFRSPCLSGRPRRHGLAENGSPHAQPVALTLAGKLDRRCLTARAMERRANAGRTRCTLATRPRQTRFLSVPLGLWRTLASRPLCRHGGTQQPLLAAPKCPGFLFSSPGLGWPWGGFGVSCSSQREKQGMEGKSRTERKASPGIAVMTR